ncbi:MAG: hypothetical protein VX664_12565 [Chloroflexota bacterium]|uniref:Uncharacterized protein n=1 Tax=marine metagenome TaxID=408172 RepID=A0A381V1B0_9ZZZZ|nr:hypothetical protein [Chloroflexota bacterium]
MAPGNLISGVNHTGDQSVFDSPERGTFFSRAVGGVRTYARWIEDYLPFNTHKR